MNEQKDEEAEGAALLIVFGLWFLLLTAIVGGLLYFLRTL